MVNIKGNCFSRQVFRLIHLDELDFTAFLYGIKIDWSNLYCVLIPDLIHVVVFDYCSSSGFDFMSAAHRMVK